jgi:hypothetical protein
MDFRNQNYRLASGVEYIGETGDEVHLRVSMPTDEDGHLGRQCPSCSQIWRMHAGDYQALPDDLRLWCVYCGYEDDHSEFITKQQLDRAMRAVGDVGVQLMQDALDRAFRPLARSSRSSFVSIEYRSKPFYPDPLPGINEERLIRERNCNTWSVRYAIFGDHRYCPVCGPLPPDVVAFDALAAEITRLDALATLPASELTRLHEQGVFQRLWVDTIENLVGIFETLARPVFRTHVGNADQVLRSKGNVFQRLEDAADIYVAHGLGDFRAAVDPTVWQRLRRTWATRHVFTHNDGIVDQRYLDAVPGSPLKVGQRLTVSEAFCREAIEDTRRLCEELLALGRPDRLHA